MATINIGAMTDDQRAAQAAAVAAANKANGQTSTGTDAGTKLNADFNFFLKMLTTQLTHQDPTQPMDTSQMTQQIATFSGVEQQVQTNSRLDKLLTANKQSQLSTAVSYIGTEVETLGNTGDVLGGQGAFAYILPKAASTVDIVIKNSAGSVVFTGPGTKTAGRNLLVWDGKNSTTGAQMPDGTYTMEVTAKDSAGAAMTAEKRSVGIVSGIETAADGTIMLNIGDHQVKYDDILAVRTPTRAQLSDNSGDTSGDTSTDGSSS